MVRFRAFAHLPAAAAAALLACAGGDGRSDRRPATDGDADADADSDTDREPDDGDASVVHLTAEEGPSAWFLGRFRLETRAPVPGVTFDLPDGPDDCRLTTYTLDELGGGVAGAYTSQRVGPLTVRGPGVEQTLEPGTDDVYELALDPLTFPFGSTWDLEAPGDTWPALSLAGAIEVGPAWTLSAPAPGFTLAGPLSLAWSGGDEAPLRVRLETSGAGDARCTLICDLDNDGAFTIDGALIDGLPPGRASLHVEQAHGGYHEVDGRTLRVTGSVVTIVVGTRP
jgi:hypothetical protein